MKEKEKENWLKRVWRRWWYIINAICTLVYIIWRIFFTIPVEYGWVSLVSGIALIVVEVFGMFEAWVHYYDMHDVRVPKLPDVPLDRFPDVDVFIATYSEPEELLYKTINGCLHMDYPDKSKVHIYLCDDNRRPSMRKLAEKMGINYLDRENNEHAKAGNLNHALSVTSSPLVVTFDADMIPNHNFLMRMVPYFVDAEIKNEGRDEKDKIRMGFVQSPQSFYNTDLYQFNLFSESRIPNEQDYFYKDIQVSRNKSNSVIYGGSNTMLSRAALEDIGGFYTDAITEDFATGLCLQKKGYVCYGINEVLASGLSPTDLKSLIQQRVRWGRGVISTGKKLHIFMTKGLSWGQKMNYWSSVWYWYAPIKRFVYIMSPIMFAVFGYMVIKCTLLQVLIFWLPMYVTSNIALRMLSNNIRTTKWTSVYEVVLFPFMLIPIIAETFGISLKKFKVTQKDGPEDERGKNGIYMIPFLLLIVLSVIGICNCVRMMFQSGSLDPIVVLFWLLNNLFGLVMAIFFVSGRTLYRKTERVFASVDCTIRYRGDVYHGMTKDLSEGGVSVIFEAPMDLDDQDTVDIQLKTDRYEATVKGAVTNVSGGKNQWKYAFVIQDMAEGHDDYLGILYDREPTLPTNLDESSGFFDDLKTNIERRAAKTFYEKRKMARIPMEASVQVEGGGKTQIANFNYKFVAIRMEKAPEQMVLRLAEGLKLVCRKERVLPNGLKLYSVVNYKENNENRVKRIQLQKWIEQNREKTDGSNRLGSGQSDEKKPNDKAKEFSEMQWL
ncbi:MAG: glycosyltransferase [Clostridiales bacterium]|nr:glycosyltransferase [Clostridiales bacterium]